MIKTSDIVNKVFSKSFMGYDVREVDAFLDDMITEIETLQKERLEMTAAMEEMLQELKRYDSIVAASGGVQPDRMLESADTRRRLAQPRRIAQPRAAIAPAPGADLPDDTVRAIADAVALEIETGTAAPRKKSVEEELRRVPQQPEQPRSAWKKEADLP